MKEIVTERLILRPFKESDYDDLYEFLSQLRDDEFEGYPGISYENGREHLAYRLGSEEFYAAELANTGKVIGNIYCGSRVFGARRISRRISGSAKTKTARRYGRIRMFTRCSRAIFPPGDRGCPGKRVSTGGCAAF